MKQINNTTFQAPELGDIKPVVIIGGKPADKFIPNVNISFHDDEFFVNLNRKNKTAINKCENSVELPGEDTDIWYIDDSGRLKWDIEFSEKPSVNTWTWELKYSKGIEFFYQGELTAEEIADGCIRPDEVIGSYAVYCNQQHNKYKTGKLCHIYRPYCYDANGKHVYAELNISGNALTITIPQEYLDNAVYPVRLDPTFGYTTQGGSTHGYAGAAFASHFACPESGTATSISAYVTNSSGNNWHYALYLYNSGGDETLLSGTATGSGVSSGVSTLSLSSSQAVSATEYALAFEMDNSAVTFYYDSLTAEQGGWASHSYGSWPSALGITFNNTRRYSIYCTYSTGGSSHVLGIMQAMNQFNGGL